MTQAKHLLISLEERHAVKILAGEKRVELRRRTMHVSKDDLVWLYVKKPIGAVVGFVRVSTCSSDTPSIVWQKFGNSTGLLKTEFVEYFYGSNAAFALGVKDPNALERPIALSKLREASPGFNPPQFYCRIEEKSALLKLLIQNYKSDKTPTTESIVK
jgi:predicted transcriptional regulator